MGVPVAMPAWPLPDRDRPVGSVYTGGNGKIAAHGGDNPQDRDVPLS